MAYFDGFNDGTYTDVATSGPTLQYNLASGSYPNLYAGNNEVGNLIKTSVPFIVGPNESIRIEAEKTHLLTNVPGSDDKYPMYNPNDQRFVFSGITPDEEELLTTYGKVFFYEVFVTDQSTGNVIAHEFMQLDSQGYPSGSLSASQKSPHWNPVNDLGGTQMTGNAPGGLGSIPLYFLNANQPNGTIWTPLVGSHICDSREVIFDLPVNMHRVPLIGTDNLVLDVLGSSRHGWLNSSIYLHIE